MQIQHKSVEVAYFDGLGRPIQMVRQGASATLSDQIVSTQYDLLEHPFRKYLPYTDGGGTGSFRATGGASAVGFYSSPPSPTIVTTTTPFSDTKFESSPLDREIEQGFPGADWQIGSGHSNQKNYDVNSTTELPTLFTISGTTVSGLSAYNAGTLYKITTTDENGNNTYEFTDHQGKLIWKWADGKAAGALQTYYVYNDLDQLAYVLPPKATNLVGAQNNTFSESTSDPLFNENIYAYHYDARGRVVEKKIPGKDWQYIVYNTLDQVVLTQDGYQRATGRWLYTKYDGQGRVIQKGAWTSNPDRLTLQATVNAQTVLWEDRLGNANYPGTSFPQSLATWFATFYYDDYAFTGASAKPFAANPYNSSFSIQTEGLQTGMAVTVLSVGGTLVTVNYYDNLGRVIQTQSDNYLRGTNVTSNQLDFVGEVTASQRVYTTNGITTTIKNRYTFDNQGRKINTYEQINSYPEILLSQNGYNEIGQLISKGLNSMNVTSQTQNLPTSIVENTTLSGNIVDQATASITLAPGFSVSSSNTTSYFAQIISPAFAQNIDYRYNERGWLTSINNSKLSDDGGVTNHDTNDLFGEAVRYNQTDALAKRQWNGNISDVRWKTRNDLFGISGLPLTSQAQAFTYDALNRLTVGQYFTNNGTSFTSNQSFTEQQGYDAMGNITSLSRYGSSTKIPINNFTYSYFNNGSRLSAVTDAGSLKAGGTYTYDVNGNMLTDTRQKLGNIHYNYFNLPDIITQGTTQMTITYDGLGNKIAKVVMGTGTYSRRDYVGELELTKSSATANSTIDFIHTEEGRATPNGTSFLYDYFLKDHLGNVRFDFRVTSDNKTITPLQFQDYYPFGSDARGHSVNSQNYKYNTKEQQNELGLSSYDYGARWYDPVIGRFTSVDPLSEQSRRFSPYAYGFNNPLRFIEKDGMAPEDIVDRNGRHIEITRNSDGSLSFSSNADASTRTISNALNLTSTGQAQLNNLIKSDIKVSLNLSSESKIETKNGLTQVTNGETRQGNTNATDNYGKKVNSDGTMGIKEAKITIYDGSVKEGIKNGSGAKLEGLTEKQAIGAVAAHEAVHATDKSEINKDLQAEQKGQTRTDGEVKPNEIERRVIKEYGL